ncbi:hypothetical protein Avbf_15426 [Armadillidium vulgare]|nr:hypothetical protein Avbf_15426 [Armadillidium vulgare]
MYKVRIIKSHPSEANRKKARELLLNKLDNHYNGEMSIENQKTNPGKKLALERKREKRLLMKKAWKESEESDYEGRNVWQRTPNIRNASFSATCISHF